MHRCLRALIAPLWLGLVCAGSATAQSSPPSTDRPSSAKPEANLAVRHHERPVGSWYLSETPNFRVFHRQPWETAERVARAAERARATAYTKWGEKVPPDWAPRCDIYVHATGADYTWETGVPAAASGFARTRHEGGRVALRRIDVHCEEPDMCSAVLPHEVAHIVLAGVYGADNVPHWANEGIAVLNEPAHKVALHLGELPRYYGAGDLYKVRHLVEMTAYPEIAHLGVFYAQSISLVRFLSAAKGPERLPRLLRDAARDGWDEALRRHYGWTFEELERLWLRDTFPETRVAAGR